MVKLYLEYSRLCGPRKKRLILSRHILSFSLKDPYKLQREPKVKIRGDAARKFGFNAELNNSHEMGLLKGTYLSIKSVFNEINWEVFVHKF